MDLLDHQVVRLKQGDYEQVTVYDKNPLESAKKFHAAGFSRLHLVDLTGARQGTPFHGNLFAEIKRTTGMQLEAGGGLRSHAQVRKLFEAGLDKSTDYVMIGSLPFLNPGEFAAILAEFRNNILLTVDVWGDEIKIVGWREGSGERLLPFIEKMTAQGLNEFLVTQIQKDGMLTGPDFELYKTLVQTFPAARFIASGGVSSLADLHRLRETGLYGAILGKAYYAGHISLEEAAAFNAGR